MNTLTATRSYRVLEMSRKNRSRLSMVLGGITSEVLSIRENGSGDIIIIFKRPNYVWSDDFSNISVKELRISLHPLKEWGGHTFVRHSKTGDDYYRRWYSNIERVNGNLIWPLVAAVSQDLRHENYWISDNFREKMINIDSYDPENNTMYFGIIATSKEVILEHPLGLNELNLSFSHFDIRVIWHFSHLPSCNKGYAFFPNIASWIQNGEVDLKTRSKDKTLSMDIDGVYDFFGAAFGRLSKIHYHHLIEDWGFPQDIEFPSLSIAARSFFKRPLDDNEL